MLDSIELLAPAKVNLNLTVKGRRKDGFHDIESLMVPISIFDRLRISHVETGDLQFTCSDESLPTGNENLVVRAARLFCESTGVEPRLKISLTKEIPHGAGLGGGSSDAASTLLGLNRLFETELSRDALAKMAAELGSDIPFFIYQSAAVIRGRGETVSPQPFSQSLSLLLIKPPFGVATPWAYSQWKDSQAIPGVPMDPQAFSWGTLQNDLERPVFEKYVLLGQLKTWLLQQPEVKGALMSGSGSTIFAILPERNAGFDLGAKVAQEFGTELWCYLCQTIVLDEPKAKARVA